MSVRLYGTRRGKRGPWLPHDVWLATPAQEEMRFEAWHRNLISLRGAMHPLMVAVCVGRMDEESLRISSWSNTVHALELELKEVSGPEWCEVKGRLAASELELADAHKDWITAMQGWKKVVKDNPGRRDLEYLLLSEQKYGGASYELDSTGNLPIKALQTELNVIRWQAIAEGYKRDTGHNLPARYQRALVRMAEELE